ncbi:hypothetical protein RCL1_005924 [Eukaryota sp. TZLM3-RCL]
MTDQFKTPSLVFRSDFECGNLSEVIRRGEFEYELHIRPDERNDPKAMALWFYFSVSIQQPNTVLLLRIIGSSKLKSNYRHGQSPVVRSFYQGTFSEWQKVSPKNVYYYKPCPSSNSYETAFIFSFSLSCDYYFAYSYPYSYTHLQKFLYTLSLVNCPTLHRSALCRTLLGNRIELLSSVPSLLSLSSLPYPSIFISARAHPGESPSSWVMEGLLEFFSSNCSSRLRSFCAIYCVPMLNPDGVVNGNYRTDMLGNDFNRVWNRHSTSLIGDLVDSPVKYYVDMIQGCIQNQHTFPAFSLDIHSHSYLKEAFLFGNKFSKVSGYHHNPIMRQWDVDDSLRSKLCNEQGLNPANFNFYLGFFPDEPEEFAKLFCKKDLTVCLNQCRFEDLSESKILTHSSSSASLDSLSTHTNTESEKQKEGVVLGTQRHVLGKLLKPFGGHAMTLEVSSSLSNALETRGSGNCLLHGNTPQYSTAALKNLGWNLGFALDDYLHTKYVQKRMVKKFWTDKSRSNEVCE